jgi:hypothetical protein
MEDKCKNCHESITGNFCINCGQKKYKRIDRKYVWDEVQYTFLHTNKGFLYSVKNIIKNPGKTAREFIEGNRVNHYKPILLAFVLSGISAFISFKIIGFKEIVSEYYSNQNMNSEFMSDYVTFTSSYNSIIMLLLIPFFALITKLAFRKWGHNYYEHVIINAYILSFYTLINILLLYPLLFILKDNHELVMSISGKSMFITPLVLLWFFRSFYHEKPLGQILLRMVWIVLLLIASFIVFITLIALLGFLYATIKGPEALQYLKPQ